MKNIPSFQPSTSALKTEDGLHEELALMCSTWKEADKEKVRRTKRSGSDKCLVNIQTEPRPTLSLQTCARALSEEPADKRGNNERWVSLTDIIETIAIPSCDVLSWVITHRRIHVCLNDVKNKTYTVQIKCKKTHRAGEPPSKPVARTRSQMHFFLEHRVTQRGVKEKRH